MFYFLLCLSHARLAYIMVATARNVPKCLKHNSSSSSDLFTLDLTFSPKNETCVQGYEDGAKENEEKWGRLSLCFPLRAGSGPWSGLR